MRHTGTLTHTKPCQIKTFSRAELPTVVQATLCTLKLSLRGTLLVSRGCNPVCMNTDLNWTCGFFFVFFKLRTEVKNSVNTSIRSYGLCLFKSTPIKCFANFEMALFMLDDMVRWYTRHFFDYSKEKELERKRADQRGVGGNKTQTMRAGSAAVCLCLQLSSRLSLECGSEYKKKQVFYI